MADWSETWKCEEGIDWENLPKARQEEIAWETFHNGYGLPEREQEYIKNFPVCDDRELIIANIIKNEFVEYESINKRKELGEVAGYVFAKSNKEKLLCAVAPEPSLTAVESIWNEAGTKEFESLFDEKSN